MRILVIEDDVVIGENLVKIIRKQGMAPELCQTLAEARAKLEVEEYDCVVLDRRLPDGEGVLFLSEQRENGAQWPALILSAKSQKQDVIEGLDHGADDYLTKPFSATELLARIRALLRRKKRMILSPTLRVGSLELDTNTQQVRREGKVISLSPREYQLLEYLAREAGRVVPRTELLEHSWGEEVDLFSNSLEVHIAYLRRKIDRQYAAKMIQTVKNKGYMLCAA